MLDVGERSMKLLEGVVGVSVDLDVLQDPAVNLRVGQALLRNHAGEHMTSLVDVVKESVDLDEVPPLMVVVLKAVQLAQKYYSRKHGLSGLQGPKRISPSRRRARYRRDKSRQEGVQSMATS